MIRACGWSAPGAVVPLASRAGALGSATAPAAPRGATGAVCALSSACSGGSLVAPGWPPEEHATAKAVGANSHHECGLRVVGYIDIGNVPFEMAHVGHGRAVARVTSDAIGTAQRAPMTTEPALKQPRHATSRELFAATERRVLRAAARKLLANCRLLVFWRCEA
jgi:hypothetical protein